MPNKTLKISPQTICFVCTANICRSPFAEGYLRRRLQEENLPHQVVSAGVQAIHGSATTEQIIAIAREFNVNLDPHRSQPLTHDLMDACQLIIGMEAFHINEIVLRYAFTKNKTFLIRHFAKSGSTTRGIQDPYGSTDDFIRSCFEDIMQAVDGLVENLKK